MTTQVLSLRTSKRLAELLPDVETEMYWNRYGDEYKVTDHSNADIEDTSGIPAHNFAETIRLIPALARKLKWGLDITEDEDGNLRDSETVNYTNIMVGKYMDALTPESGMESVDAYVWNLIKP